MGIISNTENLEKEKERRKKKLVWKTVESFQEDDLSKENFANTSPHSSENWRWAAPDFSENSELILYGGNDFKYANRFSLAEIE